VSKKKDDAAAAARLWKQVSRAEVPEEKPTEPPDPVVFGKSGKK
jgi:hypothetical protein